MKDCEFVSWMADRMVHVYGESPNVDFVHRARAVAENISRYDLTADSCESLRARLAKYEDADGRPLRAVALPEPMKRGDEGGSGEYGAAMIRGYNACLREVARLNESPVSAGGLDERAKAIDAMVELFESVACKQNYDMRGGVAAVYDACTRTVSSAPSHGEQVEEIARLRDLLTAWWRMFDGGIASGELGVLRGQTDAALAKP